MSEEHKKVSECSCVASFLLAFMTIAMISVFMFYYVHKTDLKMHELEDKWIVRDRIWGMEYNAGSLEQEIKSIQDKVIMSCPTHVDINILNQKILELGNAIGYHYASPVTIQTSAYWKKGAGDNYRDDFGTNTSN